MTEHCGALAFGGPCERRKDHDGSHATIAAHGFTSMPDCPHTWETEAGLGFACGDCGKYNPSLLAPHSAKSEANRYLVAAPELWWMDQDHASAPAENEEVVVLAKDYDKMVRERDEAIAERDEMRRANVTPEDADRPYGQSVEYWQDRALDYATFYDRLRVELAQLKREQSEALHDH